jgi:dihydroorotase
MHDLLLRGGRVIDSATGLDELRDLLVRGGEIAAIDLPGAIPAPAGGTVEDVGGCWIVPGLVDLHVHLRDPGQEYKEDVESGGRAAAAGGFTTVCCMANTKPVNDTRAVTEYIISRARTLSPVHIRPLGAVTVGLQGKALTEMADLQEAGIVAVSDDGHPVADAGVYRRAMEYARGLGLTVVGHCEEPSLTADGVMHEGAAATRAGLPGIPAASEDVAVGRDIELVRLTGCSYHIAHLSTAGAVDMVRRAKSDGLRVTAEVTPHHLTLCDEDVIAAGYDTRFKMAPPLRSIADRQAVIEGLADGTIDAIATDHAPHSRLEKDVEFKDAANGVTGLETAVPLVLALVRSGALSRMRAIDALTQAAARCFSLGEGVGRLAIGGAADITVLDPEARWTVDVAGFKSKGANSPFIGQSMQGRARLTYVGGELV